MHTTVDTFFAVVKAVFLLIICGIHAIKPRFFWDNVASWYSDKEPSEFYFDMVRILSAISFIIVFYALYAEFFGPLF